MNTRIERLADARTYVMATASWLQKIVDNGEGYDADDLFAMVADLREGASIVEALAMDVEYD